MWKTGLIGVTALTALLGWTAPIAMFDAINSIEWEYEPYRVRFQHRASGSPEAAAAQAAHDVLPGLFPASKPVYDAALADGFGTYPSGFVKRGAAVGAMVAEGILEWRQNGGWADPQPAYVLPPFPGLWQSTPPNHPVAATSKYVYGFWRPVTAIRRADEDLNDATVPDPSWLPFLTTPPYPSYPGNMAAAGYSAARALELAVGTNEVSVTARWRQSSGVPDVLHSHQTLSQLADEQARSRVLAAFTTSSIVMPAGSWAPESATTSSRIT